MGDAPSIAAENGSRERPAQRGFFAVLLEALHHSRRLQAARAIQQYRHLIAQPDEGGPRNLIPKILVPKIESNQHADE